MQLAGYSMRESQTGDTLFSDRSDEIGAREYSMRRALAQFYLS